MIQKKLKSGLRLIMLPRAEMQTATVLVLIGVGSRYETVKQNGLSHFLEHMFFKGTKNRPTTKEIVEEIENVGGDFNAFTSEEYTGYYVKTAGEHLPVAMDVVSDILLRPLFPQEEITKEVGVIKEEIKMYTDMPMRHIHHLWSKALFGDTPLGRRIDGSAESVDAFVRRDFVNYAKKHYHTENTVVAVAGNFDPKEVAKQVQKLFKELPEGKETSPKKAPSAKKPSMPVVHEYRKHVDQTQLMVGAPGVSGKDPRRFAVELLSVILGGGMSSRLFLSIRERNGLAYSVKTYSENFTDTGSFVTQAGVRTDKAEMAMKLIVEEYNRVMEELVDEAELTKARQILRGSMVRDLEETNELAFYSASQELLEKHLETPDEAWEMISKVTPEDIRDVARDLLSPDKRALAILGPQKSVKAFEKLLK